MFSDHSLDFCCLCIFLQPIFSGAAWAGSVLWAAAEVLVEHMLLNKRTIIEGASILELGCGLGVPGMVCSLLGAKEVLLTEQDQLVPLLVKNIETNFPTSPNEDGDVDNDALVYSRPKAVPLNWGTEESIQFMSNRAIETNTKSAREEENSDGTKSVKPFDVILICDCVFEPLYGDSWKLLCETLAVVAVDNTTEVLISCERRSEDAIDDFLEMLSEHFIVDNIWTNFDDVDLPALLQRSHVGGEKKPLRIFSARRKQ